MAETENWGRVAISLAGFLVITNGRIGVITEAGAGAMGIAGAAVNKTGARSWGSEGSGSPETMVSYNVSGAVGWLSDGHYRVPWRDIRFDKRRRRPSASS